MVGSTRLSDNVLSAHLFLQVLMVNALILSDAGALSQPMYSYLRIWFFGKVEKGRAEMNSMESSGTELE